MMVRGGGVDAAPQRKEHRRGGYSGIKNSTADLCDLAVIQFHVLSLHVGLSFSCHVLQKLGYVTTLMTKFLKHRIWVSPQQ
jgi:hypothetical protein